MFAALRFRRKWPILITVLALALLTSLEARAEGYRYIVQVDKYEFELKLNSEYSAQYFADALPIDLEMKRWGDQFYGASPVIFDSYIESTSSMQVGHLAYWPPGQTLCLFFGSTPTSPGLSPQLGSPGLVLGSLIGDVTLLRSLGPQTSLTIYVVE